jgi:hypothetical protein
MANAIHASSLRLFAAGLLAAPAPAEPIDFDFT